MQASTTTAYYRIKAITWQSIDIWFILLVAWSNCTNWIEEHCQIVGEKTRFDIYWIANIFSSHQPRVDEFLHELSVNVASRWCMVFSIIKIKHFPLVSKNFVREYVSLLYAISMHANKMAKMEKACNVSLNIKINRRTDYLQIFALCAFRNHI